MRIKIYNKNKLTHQNITFLMFVIINSWFVINAYSQVKEEWVARYNGPGNYIDHANAISTDSLRNVYVTGFSTGSGTSRDYATIKYNSLGVEQWVVRYNGPGNDYDEAYAMAIDSSGNVYVTGGSYGLGTLNDYTTIKYNNAGVEQWVAKYDGPGNYYDRALAIAVDSSENVYVTGQSTGSGTDFDYATIKYDSSGVEQWVTRYDGPINYFDSAHAIAIDSLGNVYVTGCSEGLGTRSDYLTIKYNSEGIEQWVARYNGPGNDLDDAYAIALDSSENVYITGLSTGSGTYYDYATIKYNSAGIEQWVARYNDLGNSEDWARAIVLDSLGNVYVTGWSNGLANWYDYATIKYNSSGIEQWVVRYNGPGNYMDEAYAIAIDSSGNVYVTGRSGGSGTDYDYATIKYNSTGIEKWVARYNGPGNGGDGAYEIAVDSSGNVYVTGYSRSPGTSSDYATIKYSQSTFSESFYLY